MHDNTNDIYLIKTDNTGTILWSHTYGGPLWDKAHTVQQTRDGGYIIAGITRTLSGGILDGPGHILDEIGMNVMPLGKLMMVAILFRVVPGPSVWVIWICFF